MPSPEKPTTSTASRIVWITGISCVACCAVPLIGVLIGSATVAGLAIYSEEFAALVAVIGVSLLIIRRLTRKTGPACNLDGSCGPGKDAGEGRK